MPITGRKPADCFRAFRDHLGPVLAAALGSQHHVVVHEVPGQETRRTLSLGPDRATAGIRLSIGSRGSFYFSLRQNLEAVRPKDEKQYQLKTRAYRYAIAESDDAMAEAILRWEYSSVALQDKHCRHHFQLGRVQQKAVSVPFNSRSLDLNRLHTPTGFVLIEYVLRFLLTDMGVAPATEHWEDVLSKSEEMFFTEFSRRTAL